MALYIFRYCVRLRKAELEQLENFNIEVGLKDAILSGNAYEVFGKYGKGVDVTNNVFIVRANNYKDCMNFIGLHKGIIESSAWQRGTFGEQGLCTQAERFETANNKIHMMKCINSNGSIDVIACYRVPEDYADKRVFFDAVAWAESCRGAVNRDCKLPQYARHRVYN